MVSGNSEYWSFQLWDNFPGTGQSQGAQMRTKNKSGAEHCFSKYVGTRTQAATPTRGYSEPPLFCGPFSSSRVHNTSPAPQWASPHIQRLNSCLLSTNQAHSLPLLTSFSLPSACWGEGSLPRTLQTHTHACTHSFSHIFLCVQDLDWAFPRPFLGFLAAFCYVHDN